VLVVATALGLIVGVSGKAAIVQQGNLRVSVSTQVKPFKLPRGERAPIAVFVAGRVAAVRGGVPEQLKRLTVKVNRHGRFQSRGLPVCQIPRVQPATSSRALDNCGSAIVGSGKFWANIVLPDQGAYPTRGRLLLFNGRQGGRPVLLAHIFTANPFYSSFVVVFRMKRLRGGAFGTELSASLPQALGDWGYVDRIKLTLRRTYAFRGRQRSYFSASCPAPRGVRFISYPLARATFSFAGRKQISTIVQKTCGVKE
jgi:hypothetical protein